jgi:tetratricopeptide (TPR) repeat protein
MAAGFVGVAAAAMVGAIMLLLWHNLSLSEAVRQARADERSAQQRVQNLIQQQLDDEQARDRARKQFEQFIRLRDDALFYSIYATRNLGSDAQSRRDTARVAAQQALKIAGWSPGSPLQPNAFLDPAVQQELRVGCYELLLLLAETSAQPERGKAPEAVQTQLVAALEYLDHAARDFPPTPALHARRARYLRLLGRNTEAEREQNQAQALPPTDPLDYFLLGDEEYRAGNIARARTDFEQALALQPGHFWALYYLAFCWLEQQRPAEAWVALTVSLRARPDFVWTYVLRGFAQAQLRAFPAAEADFAKALSLGPDDEALHALHANRGVLRWEEGRLDEAIEDLRRAIIIRPGNHEPHLTLSRVYHRQGRFDLALEQLDRAAGLHPPTAVAASIQARRGQMLFLLCRFDEAARACAEALKLRPGFPDALGILGQAQSARKQYAAAVTSFNGYFEGGGKPETLIYRRRGHALLQLGRCDEAIHDFTLALALAPDADVFSQRGWAHFFREQWKSAAADFEEALRLRPGFSEALIGRGLVRVSLRDYRAAIADAESALRQPPREPELLHNLACIFAQAAGQADADHSQGTHPSATVRYREQAVRILREALLLIPEAERSAFLRDKMLPDPALNSLRRMPEFERLIEDHRLTKPPR